MVILGAKSTVALQPCKGGDEECVGARLTLRIRSIGRLDSARSGPMRPTAFGIDASRRPTLPASNLFNHTIGARPYRCCNLDA
jgi:hypothetical protein